MSRPKAEKALEPQSNAKAKQTSVPEDASISTPEIDEGSFKNLQERIQAKLQNANKQKGKKKESKAKSTDNKDVQSQPTQKEDARPKPAEKRVAKDIPRGKKRTSDGKVIDSKRQPQQKQQQPTSSNAIPLGQGSNEEDDELRKALQELGGTQEDLDLMEGVDSDSEVEGTDGVVSKDKASKDGKSLEKGMSNILKEIALAQGARQDDVSEDEFEEEASEDEPEEVETSLPQKSDKKNGRSRLKCEPRPDWFNIPAPTVNMDKGPIFTATQMSMDQLHAHAKTLLEEENEAFKTTQQSSSSQAFYNTVVASGTLSDKISALTLAVQESPLHNVRALESLIGLATKRNRAQAIDVLRALKDLLAQGSLLPSDRKLYAFNSQPAVINAVGQVQAWRKGDKLPKGLSEPDIMCWAYESWLKEQYFEILKSLEIWCNDEIEFSKQRAVSYVYELLREKPEQETNLLRLLVNKLGDPVKKIASQTSYLLMQLLVSHPAMKMVVISAIEADFLFRPGQSMHGKYYAVTTLNQTALSQREEDVAVKLLDIYFGLFTGLLRPVTDKALEAPKSDEPEGVVSLNRRQQQRKKGRKEEPVNAQGEELREKLISAVLTGVNRAYPYAGADQKNFNQHLDTLFTITHSANFNTSIQAMLLIQQLTATSQAASDRFYRTLYESLLDPRLVTASKQQLYLNLLHRSLKADVSIKRVKAFVKRLLQILSLHDPAFVCGVFFLLKDLEKTFPSLTALLDTPVDQEDDVENFQDVDEDAQPSVRVESDETKPSNLYDGHKRAPEHANADNSSAWELLPFLAHFHPSVSVSADNYLQQLKLPGKPDLTLHTLIHFLDRFVYRNPKLSSNKMRGASIMQPMAGDDTHAVLINSVAKQTGPAVNTDEFRNKKDEDVAADDAFFHKYFTTLGKDSKAKKPKKARDLDDDASIGDEGEDEVWKAMMDSAPDLEGEGSDDEDLDMSDFDDEMDNSDLEAPDMDEDGSDSGVDIEAGIFDDNDEDEISGVELEADVEEEESEFEGLDSELDEAAAKKKERNKTKKEERKKKKSLPTFASAADYAKMLEDDEDEDLG